MHEKLAFYHYIYFVHSLSKWYLAKKSKNIQMVLLPQKNAMLWN